MLRSASALGTWGISFSAYKFVDFFFILFTASVKDAYLPISHIEPLVRARRVLQWAFIGAANVYDAQPSITARDLPQNFCFPNIYISETDFHSIFHLL